MAAAAPAPAHSQEDTHVFLTRAAQILSGSQASLRNNISAHKVKNPISFQALDTFCVNATKPGGTGASQLFLSSLDGGPVVSARLRVEPESQGRSGKAKRARDDAAERAELACAKLRRLPGQLTKAQIDLAQKTIEDLLRGVRGPRSEEVFEACGVSVAPVLTTKASQGVSATAANRPRLIIACRLSAGVPLSLKALRLALGECFKDGMITTHPESLGPEYQLPLTDTGRAVENQGQRSMLLFAAVPEKADPPVTSKVEGTGKSQ
jgi:hypothetical protein